MRLFDKLPKVIRDALHACRGDYPIQDIYDRWRERGTACVLRDIEATERHEAHKVVMAGGIAPPPAIKPMTDDEVLAPNPPRRLTGEEIDRKQRLLIERGFV